MPSRRPHPLPESLRAVHPHKAERTGDRMGRHFAFGGGPSEIAASVKYHDLRRQFHFYSAIDTAGPSSYSRCACKSIGLPVRGEPIVRWGRKATGLRGRTRLPSCRETCSSAFCFRSAGLAWKARGEASPAAGRWGREDIGRPRVVRRDRTGPHRRRKEALRAPRSAPVDAAPEERGQRGAVQGKLPVRTGRKATGLLASGGSRLPVPPV